MPQIEVGILLFDEIDLLDFSGPYEVFTIARTSDDADAQRPFRVRTLAEGNFPIRTAGGLRIVPDEDLNLVQELDVLIIPGGPGSRRQVANVRLMEWLHHAGKEVPVLASICTGAFLLAQSGHLDGKRATTHWGSLARLGNAYPQVEVVQGVRYVDEGRILTSAGIYSGIVLALHLVDRLVGRMAARRAADLLDLDDAYTEEAGGGWQDDASIIS